MEISFIAKGIDVDLNVGYTLTVIIQSTCIKQSALLLKYVIYTMQVLDRGEKIELLVDKTENLRSQVHCSLLYALLFHPLKQ